MTMPVLACAEFDASGTVCVTEVWIEQAGSPFPVLSAEEGALIASAILLVWAGGYVIRVCARLLNQS